LLGVPRPDKFGVEGTIIDDGIRDVGTVKAISLLPLCEGSFDVRDTVESTVRIPFSIDEAKTDPTSSSFVSSSSNKRF
jgi:hypothetical protein